MVSFAWGGEDKVGSASPGMGSGHRGGSCRERSGSRAARAGFPPASWGGESQPNATLQSQQVPRAE